MRSAILYIDALIFSVYFSFLLSRAWQKWCDSMCEYTTIRFFFCYRAHVARKYKCCWIYFLSVTLCLESSSLIFPDKTLLGQMHFIFFILTIHLALKGQKFYEPFVMYLHLKFDPSTNSSLISPWWLEMKCTCTWQPAHQNVKYISSCMLCNRTTLSACRWKPPSSLKKNHLKIRIYFSSDGNYIRSLSFVSLRPYLFYEK